MSVTGELLAWSGLAWDGLVHAVAQLDPLVTVATAALILGARLFEGPLARGPLRAARVEQAMRDGWRAPTTYLRTRGVHRALARVLREDCRAAGEVHVALTVDRMVRQRHSRGESGPQPFDSVSRTSATWSG